MRRRNTGYLFRERTGVWLFVNFITVRKTEKTGAAVVMRGVRGPDSGSQLSAWRPGTLPVSPSSFLSKLGPGNASSKACARD